MTPHHDNRPRKLVRLPEVERKGHVVATTYGMALVFHRVTEPAYRGVFRDGAA